jgi:hypothetical protein
MALYESLSHQDLSVASGAAADGSQPSISDQLVGALRLGLVLVLLACWMAGGYAGIVYWSVEGSLLGVIAASSVSGLGATSTWTLFTGLVRR